MKSAVAQPPKLIEQFDKLKHIGTVERRLFSGQKFYKNLIRAGVRLNSDPLSYNINTLYLSAIRELPKNVVDKALENSAKKQFKDNFLWRMFKKFLNIDLQIPFITGYWTLSPIKKNLVVNTGIKKAADQIGGTTTAPVTAIAIGTGTVAPAATDTALGAEITTLGGARGAATVSNTTTTTTGDTEKWIKTFTFTGSFALTEEGLFDNNVSGGIMLARNTFAAVNVVSGDNLQITHTVQA